MTGVHSTNTQPVSAGELATAIAGQDFSGCTATVIGYGFMGKHYVQALNALGVGRVRVCSRSAGPLEALRGEPGVTTLPGGYEHLNGPADPKDIAIVAVPTVQLDSAVKHIASCGFRKILIEKPVSLWSTVIESLAESLEHRGIDAVCAYNRVAYPSFLEARARTDQEGGITSCTYGFTEIIGQDWTERYPPEELARWGIANSLHPIGMAHGLIGLPASWSATRSGGLSWHPAGSVFVGSGISDRDIPFAYQADWGSKGRWSVEVHSRQASYRLCPLEKLYTKTSPLEDWEELPIPAFAPAVKVGVAEQVGAMLSEDIRQTVPLISLEKTARLTAYGEEIFGYGPA